MAKTCSFEKCEINFESLIATFDNGSELIALCPNHAAIYAIHESIDDPLTLQVYPSELKDQVHVCDGCGTKKEENCYLYKTSTNDGIELEIHLCHPHLLRLIAHQLEPEAFLNIYKKHGVFHEIHDDFYDEETGEALQPMELVI
jgi:hypothetical protein